MNILLLDSLNNFDIYSDNELIELTCIMLGLIKKTQIWLVEKTRPKVYRFGLREKQKETKETKDKRKEEKRKEKKRKKEKKEKRKE